jgi:hypothetical protein
MVVRQEIEYGRIKFVREYYRGETEDVLIQKRAGSIEIVGVTGFSRTVVFESKKYIWF